MQMRMENAVVFGVFNVSDSTIGACPLFAANFGLSGGLIGVRAVVCLESDVQLEENGANAWKIVENN